MLSNVLEYERETALTLMKPNVIEESGDPA